MTDRRDSEIDRRTFLVSAGALGLGILLRGSVARAAAEGITNVGGADATPSLFILIEADGTVRLTCHRSEMGQQSWTAMAQIMADELEADWKRIEIVQAVGHPRYGDQNTDGSRSVRKNFTRLRTAGAAMRLMLERAAAKRWGVGPRTCSAELGKVIHGRTKRELSFGDLAEGVLSEPVPRLEDVVLKKPARWRYINKSIASLTVPKIVRGAGTFGIDMQLPKMRYAVIARPPQVLGSVRKVDDSATLRISGVERTVKLEAPKAPVRFQPLGGVAVVAKDTWSAIKGREALKIEWNAGPNASYDSEKFKASLAEAARSPGTARRNRGDALGVLGRAKSKVSAEYYVPHLAHSAMEPPAVTARWTGKKVECWGCVQAPQAARSTVAEVCGVKEDDVTIHVTWLGGAFGRKSKPDYFGEAALVAREVGAPVKVVWTREDDLGHSYYHTVSMQRMEGALDERGRCTAFLHRAVFPPIRSTFVEGATSPTWGDLQQGASDNPFAVPNLRLETGEARAHLRTGWLRSVANIYHAFAIQSFASELAHAAGRDPKDYLLELIGPPKRVDPTKEGAEYPNYGSPLSEYPIDTARLAHVTKVAAKMAKWGRTLPKGHGLGIAAHRSFLSYVATVIEVSVDAGGRLTIVGIWSAIDAGTVVNPGNVVSQVEGGTLFGLSNALYGEITAKGGAVNQRNFPDWRVMRMNEAPRAMEVQVVDSDAPPGGVGEPPTPPAAPALTNAIFAATGLRIRDLPIFGADRRDRLPLPSSTPKE